MSSSAGRRLAAALALILAGSGLALAGGAVLARCLATSDLVATGYALRNGGLSLPAATLQARIGQLASAAGSSPSADEAAALMYFDDALADAAARRGDSAARTAALAAAREAGRQALSLAPMRADVSLVLAEIEFLRGGPGDAVDTPIRLSFLTAPRELWIVSRRVGLGLRLVTTADPQLEALIARDVRLLGQPYRGTDLYRILAAAAFRAGPPAVDMVRRELAQVHEQPLHIFEGAVAEMAARRASAGR